MRISIVTPSFNQGKYIEETIRSVLRQDHPDVEHIVIDGGSTDQTISILKKYPHVNWSSEKDSGQSNAINKGFAKANGDILAWLNSDDYYEPQIFGEIVRYFNANPDCAVLYGDITYVDESGRTLNSFSGEVLDHETLLHCPDKVRQPSTFWRRSAWEEVGQLNESLHLVMDFEFFVRLAQRHKFHYLPRNLGYYRFYSENKSLSMARRQVTELYQVYRNLGVQLDSRIVALLFKKLIHSFEIRQRLKKAARRLLDFRKAP